MGVLDIFRKPPQGEAPLKCPRDATAMGKLSRDGVAIERCESCRGIWFDAAELKRVADDAAIGKAAEWIGSYAQASAFACPRCGGKCFESFVEEVRVDTCASCHGVWLDKGELDEAKRQKSVERVIHLGGPQFREFLRKL